MNEWMMAGEAEAMSWWEAQQDHGQRREGRVLKRSSAPTSCVTLGLSLPIWTRKSLWGGATSPFSFQLPVLP